MFVAQLVGTALIILENGYSHLAAVPMAIAIIHHHRHHRHRQHVAALSTVGKVQTAAQPSVWLVETVTVLTSVIAVASLLVANVHSACYNLKQKEI
jgi:small-conductance mechanosensitive channel